MNLSDGMIVAAVLAAGGALEGLRQARASLRQQGVRLGAVEKWQSSDEGRREGRREALHEFTELRRVGDARTER